MRNNAEQYEKKKKNTHWNYLQSLSNVYRII